MLLLDLDHSAPDPQQGVIEEARRRQRRRRSTVAVALFTAALVGGAASVISRGGSHPQPSQHLSRPPSSRTLQPPQRLFAREPAMGVACPRAPNSIECDRVLFGVWLRRPAVAVDATIDGRYFKLDDPEWRRLQRDLRGKVFVGALRPAGLIHGPLKVHPDRGRYYWTGSHPVSARVRVIIHYTHGVTAAAAFDLQLRPGWG